MKAARPKRATQPRKPRRGDEVADGVIAGLKHAIAYRRGAPTPGVVVHRVPDVAAIREKVGLSQIEFAKRFGLPVGSVRDWEQKRRTPDRAAQVLLRVIEETPETVARVVNADAA